MNYNMNEITNEDYNKALLHLQSIVERVVQITELMQQGNIEMAKIEMNELYMESVNSDVRKYGTRITNIVEHLLKLAYCDNYHDVERDDRGWEISINKQRDKIIENLRWNQKKQETNIIIGINNDLQLSYAYGVRRYNNSIRRNASLQRNKNLIPGECPWQIEDILDKEIITLVEMLPSETGYYRQYLLDHSPDDILDADIE